MGSKNKKNVQLVISHLEGCAGNFLGRLYADQDLADQSSFRVDVNDLGPVCAIDGVDNWQSQLDCNFRNHRVVVTHSYDLELITTTFPQASTIQIYPYTHIGNVLYNVSFKKLDQKLPNKIDNHFIQIREWHQKFLNRRPELDCTDYWDLHSADQVQNLLGIKFSQSQTEFFKRYWQAQLPYELNLPDCPLGIKELVDYWKIDNYFNNWSVAWTIYVFELLNNLAESQRSWTIDDPVSSWSDLVKIETRYIDKHL